jgi:hypothetical protein
MVAELASVDLPRNPTNRLSISVPLAPWPRFRAGAFLLLLMHDHLFALGGRLGWSGG